MSDAIQRGTTDMPLGVQGEWTGGLKEGEGQGEGQGEGCSRLWGEPPVSYNVMHSLQNQDTSHPRIWFCQKAV